MPEEMYWNSLFDIPLIVGWLNLKSASAPIVEIGCGYGTFTVPVALHSKATVHAFDIDPSMIGIAERNVHKADAQNVSFHLLDVVEQGTGLESRSTGMVLLFNILHFRDRRILLGEASRVLIPHGAVAIIHWRKDIPTPRGPSVESPPDKEMILKSASGLDLYFNGDERILEPYHWGIQLIKTEGSKETE